MIARPPNQRFALIYATLLRREVCNCTSLAERFETSTKSIARDIDFMRDRLGLPIEYDQSARTWKLASDMPRPWWLVRPGDKEFKV